PLDYPVINFSNFGCNCWIAKIPMTNLGVIMKNNKYNMLLRNNQTIPLLVKEGLGSVNKITVEIIFSSLLFRHVPLLKMCEIVLPYKELCEVQFSGNSLEHFLRDKYAELRDDQLSHITVEWLKGEFVINFDNNGLNLTFDSSLITQAYLSKYQYEMIRNRIHNMGYTIFPSYKKVLESKKKCYPENREITEKSAKVPLQDLLGHTTERIFETQTNIQIEKPEDCELVLHTKWGCDGASGQSEFMQQFSDGDLNTSDTHLFMSSTIPMQMTQKDNEYRYIWKNPRPSSTRHCRPIKFQFKKETPELIREETNRIEEEIKQLRETKINFGICITISARHILHFTMIDGKVAQVVTNTASSSNCVICGARPSEMNNLSTVHMKPSREKSLKLGMSPLHARIRFMAYVLHGSITASGPTLSIDRCGVGRGTSSYPFTELSIVKNNLILLRGLGHWFVSNFNVPD
ncbi:hypothetical protein KPH14_011611, partial [Odynerus spinipes]